MPTARRQLIRGDRPIKTERLCHPAATARFLLAHLDDHEGGVWRLSLDGKLEPFLLEVEGRPLPPTNFVLPIATERYITVSTRLVPRARGPQPGHADGFIVLQRPARRARSSPTALGFTNEAKSTPAGAGFM